MTLRFILIAVLLGTAPLVHGQTVRQPEFRGIDPEVLGQGGSYTAIASGYKSLFTNPAGLARTSETEVTVPEMTVWSYSRPDLLLPTIGALGGDPLSSDTDETRDELILEALEEQFTTNGFGVGVSIGAGAVSDGLGAGIDVALDSYLFGDTFPLGLEGEVNARLALSVGYAQLFEIGPVGLLLGGALRPTLRVTSFVGSDEAADLIELATGVETDDEAAETDLDTILTSLNALNGWGVAFDAGIMADYRRFTFGIEARNLANTNVRYSNNTLDELIDALADGGLPESPEPGDDSYVSESYIIPMAVSFGAAWNPDLGSISYLFDPTVHAQLADPFGNADPDPDSPRSFWTRLHVGTQFRFLRFFDLRYGLNQGYFTLGMGMELTALHLNFALYGQEFGRYPGDQQVGGAALEFAIRF